MDEKRGIWLKGLGDVFFAGQDEVRCNAWHSGNERCARRAGHENPHVLESGMYWIWYDGKTGEILP